MCNIQIINANYCILKYYLFKIQYILKDKKNNHVSNIYNFYDENLIQVIFLTCCVNVPLFP